MSSCARWPHSGFAAVRVAVREEAACVPSPWEKERSCSFLRRAQSLARQLQIPQPELGSFLFLEQNHMHSWPPLTCKPVSFRLPLREMEIEGILIHMSGHFK